MPTIAQIKAAVCSHFGVSEALLDGRRGELSITYPRQLAMWLAYEGGHWIRDIGLGFGGKHHATVRHSIKAINDRIETGCGAITADLEAIRAKL